MGWIKQTRIINGPYWFLAMGLIILGMGGPGIAVIVAYNLSFDLPRWISFTNAAVLPFAVVCGLLAWRHRRRTVAVIRAHHGHVCTSCGYPLNPELDGKPCPECGRIADLARCRKVWSSYIFGGL